MKNEAGKLVGTPLRRVCRSYENKRRGKAKRGRSHGNNKAKASRADQADFVDGAHEEGSPLHGVFIGCAVHAPPSPLKQLTAHAMKNGQHSVAELGKSEEAKTNKSDHPQSGEREGARLQITERRATDPAERVGP